MSYRLKMKNLDWDKIPSFDQLPVNKGAPPESSWVCLAMMISSVA